MILNNVILNIQAKIYKMKIKKVFKDIFKIFKYSPVHWTI